MNIKLPSKYREMRSSKYPSLEEQLDMLWHAMDNNPEHRLEPWYSTIKKVKEEHKKC